MVCLVLKDLRQKPAPAASELFTVLVKSHNCRFDRPLNFAVFVTHTQTAFFQERFVF